MFVTGIINSKQLSSSSPKQNISGCGQTAVNTFASRAALDKFQLNEMKCKEMRICFSTNESLKLILLSLVTSKFISFRMLISWV